jgi:hypothetical protein
VFYTSSTLLLLFPFLLPILLHRVAEEGHEAVVKLLLEIKADVDAMDDDG